jgi:DNA gyrase/topoisomerase IV subunit A
MQAESAGAAELKEEDVVPNTPSLITVSSRGFIKRMPSSTWEPQRRGGKGEQRLTAGLSTAVGLSLIDGLNLVGLSSYRSLSFLTMVTSICKCNW